MSINKDYISRLVLDIRKSIEAINRLTSKPYETMTDAERFATRYHLIVMAEALIAIAIHIARRAFSKEPETPSHALKILKDEKLISSKEYNDLLSLIRLRNLLVHRYWVIDDERIYNNVKNNFKSIMKFIEGIMRYAE